MTPLELTPFLARTEVIDFDDPIIATLSDALRAEGRDDVDFVRRCFEFVRDRIAHSFDGRGRWVTCRASDVLRRGEGICFAKSHLLAALLRAGGVPAGFSYQRLVFDDANDSRRTLHGLNAAWIPSSEGWIRFDARGNKAGVDAQFSLAEEKLAFPVRPERGEVDYDRIWPEPDANVIRALEGASDLEMLLATLPEELQTPDGGLPRVSCSART